MKLQLWKFGNDVVNPRKIEALSINSDRDVTIYTAGSSVSLVGDRAAVFLKAIACYYYIEEK